MAWTLPIRGTTAEPPNSTLLPQHHAVPPVIGAVSVVSSFGRAGFGEAGATGDRERRNREHASEHTQSAVPDLHPSSPCRRGHTLVRPAEMLNRHGVGRPDVRGSERATVAGRRERVSLAS